MLALLLPLVLLAGCGKESKNDARSASGEVLQGTISDAMLPVDKLKSQPPLLAPDETARPAQEAEDDTADEVQAVDATSAEPAEVATPAPTATPPP